MSETENRKLKHISEKTRFLRVHNNYSIAELAGELKLHEDRILGLEKARVFAELEDVIRYCDHFCIDYEDFLFNPFSNFKSDYLKDEQKLLKAIGYKV